jgi:tetratricopeptide (TPR) repeat protein
MLTGAVALNPHAAFAYYLRGVSRLEQRKFDLALADFAKILELNPQDYMGYYAQGLLLRDKGDAAQAVALFDKALQLSPGSFSSHFNRGLAYADLGQHEKAEVDFTRAIEMVKPLGEIEPEEQDWQDQMTIAYLNRALARARQPSRYSEALADADHARADWSKPFKWNPDGALKALNDLAWFLATCPDVRFRDPARAVELAKKAIELAPKSGTRWNTVGVAHYRAGNWQAAVSALEKSIALSKGHHYCIDAFFLAMAYWQQGRKDEARNCYGKAVEWMQKNKPQDEELLRFRAEAQQLLGIGEKPKAGKEKPK